MKENNGKEFDDLHQRTKTFALRVINLVSSLPKSIVANAIARQLVRSGTSVASNTRAAYRGRSHKEFIAKIGIVIEEADESLLWMELLVESKIVTIKKLESLMNETNELIAIFVSISKKNKE